MSNANFKMNTPSHTQKMIENCTYCPKMCRFSCPVSESTRVETHSPWAKVQMTKFIDEKAVPLNKDSAQLAYRCLDCLRCQVYCEHDNDVPQILLGLKQRAIEEHVAPQAVLEFEALFEEYNNPYGENLQEKLHAVVDKKWLDYQSSVLFWPSCHSLKNHPEVIQNLLELFEKLDIPNVSVFDSEFSCCGYPLQSLGFERNFESLAEIHFHNLKKYKYIISDAPVCENTLKNIYQKSGFDLSGKVIHWLDFISEKFSEKVLDQKIDNSLIAAQKIAYHDSFFLARHLNIQESPRTILESILGYTAHELDNAKQDTLSPGLGGGYELAFPEDSETLANDLILSIEAQEIDHLITSCSWTQAKLESQNPSFKIQHLVTLMNACLC